MPGSRPYLRPLLLSLILLALLIAPAAMTPTARAQDTPGIVLSLPGNYRGFITEDTLTAFESRWNVRVHIEYTEGGMVFGGPGGQADSLEAILEAAAELAASGDVIYVSQSTLTPYATQAGYFLNLAPLANSDPTLNISDFYPAIWQSFQWDQGIWALPIAADIIIVTYDPAKFDAAGLAYPTDRWTIDDFATAARALTTYDANGAVQTPGLMAGTPSSTLPYLVRALAGVGFYDDTVVPNSPSLANPTLEYILEVWHELTAEGVATPRFFRGGEETEASPLQIAGTLGFSGRFGGEDASAETYQAALLPGGTAGLSATGFAVSSGTLYPELAYALAAYLTTLPEVASANFNSITSARQSLAGSITPSPETPGGQASGGPGRGSVIRGAFQNIPEAIQAVIDRALYVALPGAETRYSSYLDTALSSMDSGLDARSALQETEAAAIADFQNAVAAASSTSVIVATPPPEIVLAPGEIALNCAYNSGFGGGPGGGQIPNEDEWQQVITSFVASDPLVGQVNLTPVMESDLATLAANYDCFILTSNAVQGSDVSPLLNLDPLLDTDPTFNRNDLLAGVLTQLQQDNKTWAMPLAVQPQVLMYNRDLLAQAGVPEPVNGWTVDAFIDALRRLATILPADTAPFTANDPSGSYLLQLIGAFGGLPIDYRTDPPMLNFTDPATVSAIQQVLDLARQGYIAYSSTATIGGGMMRMVMDPASTAISTGVLSQLMRGFGRGPERFQTPLVETLYPQSTSRGFVSFDITTGYISATAQSPEAAYRFLSAIASHPVLFNGMPVRRSLLSDPAVVAAQGEKIAAIYAQLDALLQKPNTVVFPANSGMGGIAANFITEYWLKAAFDRYVLENGDLLTALEDAQSTTQAYLDCVAQQTSTATTSGDPMFGQFQQMATCVTLVDPSITLPGAGG